MRFYLQTFGCKSNQYESQAIRELLVDAGFVEVADPAEAETYIINSCAVTSRAGAACRNAVRKAIRSRPGLRLVATGCAVDAGETWPEKLGIHHCIPNAKKHAIAEILLNDAGPGGDPAAFPDDRLGMAINRFEGHTRAFLKIQDGCDNHCSYCVVPAVRGAPESRPPRDIIEEAARLAASGHPEIALTGINIGAYQYHGLNLAGLLLRLAGTPGLVRLRLGSIEPQELDEELVRVIRDHDAICPHLHLPLQSGDRGVLSAMNRRYGPEDFLDKVDMIQSILPFPAITTDVIVGFPGEDGVAFENTYELCRRVAFSRMHVFLFSARPGTPAARMARLANDRDIEERKKRLLELAEKQAVSFAARCLGREERVIVESDGALTDRYLRVMLGGKHESGTVLRVKITAAEDAHLLGEPIG